MSETIRRHDDLPGTVSRIQSMVINRLASGCTALSCVSRDGRYLYSLTPSPSVEDYQQLNADDVAAIQEWNLIRAERELADGSMQMTLYGIYKNEDDNLALTVTHTCFLRTMKIMKI